MKLHIIKISKGSLVDILEGDYPMIYKKDRKFEEGDLVHFVDEKGKEFAQYSHTVFKIDAIVSTSSKGYIIKDDCFLFLRRLEPVSIFNREE